jgi:hypothetical protein
MLTKKPCCGQASGPTPSWRRRAWARVRPVLRMTMLGSRLHGLFLLVAPRWTSQKGETCNACRRRRLVLDGGWRPGPTRIRSRRSSSVGHAAVGNQLSARVKRVSV